jgi:hypothetical protein
VSETLLQLRTMGLFRLSRNSCPETPESDGCATGLVVLVLEETGTSRQDPMVMHGLQWLERHQDSDGSWRAESLNEKRNPQTDVGRFMTDAATGYAVMALEDPGSSNVTPLTFNERCGCD